MRGHCWAAAAVYSGNNLLYLCAAMLAALALLGVIHGVRMLARAPDVARWMPGFATAGRPFALRAVFPCAQAHGPARLVCRWSDDGAKVRVGAYLDGGRAVLEGMLPAMARGVHVFDSPWLETAAPLGLWRLERRAAGAEWAWAVLPAPEVLPAAWHAALASGSGALAGEGDEWRDLRAYAPGDPLARVHWRKSAGAGLAETPAWLVKRFGAGPEPWADTLVVDLRAPAGPAFERVLGQARGWVEEERGAWLVLGRKRFDLRDADGLRQALRAIAAARPEARPPAEARGFVLRAGMR